METSELIFSALEQISGGIRKDLEAGELSFCYRDFQNNVSCVAGKLLKYADELCLYNKAFDLVGADDKESIVRRHIFDSICGVPVFVRTALEIGGKTGTGKRFRIADAGSGAGFPGIPLALVFPWWDFYLIERMSKRCTFLETMAAVLSLKNVKIINSDIEKSPEKNFDIVTFRAFRPLEKKITASVLSLKGDGGKILAYKAKSGKIMEEMEGIKDLVPDYKVFPVSNPLFPESERNIVVF